MVPTTGGPQQALSPFPHQFSFIAWVIHLLQ